METRKYDDPCGVARALDVVGPRWAMLVVRELLLGPKRFRDLLRGLDGMSPNVLTQRLKDLEAAGVVDRERPGVYGLTEEGAALEPVLIALGRWGRCRPLEQQGPMSPDALFLALRTTFDPAAAGDLDLEIVLQIGDDPVAVTVRDRTITMVRGAARDAATTVRGDVPGVRAMVYRGATVAEAVAAGTVTVDGDTAAVQRLVAALG